MTTRVPSLAELVRGLSRPLAPIPTGLPQQMRALDGVRVVLFDIYGTLLVSASGDIDATGTADREAIFRAAARDAGIVVEGDEPLGVRDRLVRAVTSRHDAARAGGTDWPEVDIRDVWVELMADWAGEGRCVGALSPETIERLAVAFECRANPVWPMPGFPAVLDALRGRVRLGIVSNAQFYTQVTIEALTGRTLGDLGFESELCAWSYEHRVAKPSARLLGVVLETLAGRGIAPGKVVMVGNDLAKDVAPALALGSRGVLFAGDRRSLRADAAVLADPARMPSAVVTGLDVLPGLLPGV